MDRLIDRIKEEIGELLRARLDELEEAWRNLPRTETLTISMSAKLGAGQTERDCEVGIAFSLGKVKEKVSFSWADQQLPLLSAAKKLREGSDG